MHNQFIKFTMPLDPALPTTMTILYLQCGKLATIQAFVKCEQLLLVMGQFHTLGSKSLIMTKGKESVILRIKKLK